jgi:hypothetical protein
MTPQAPPRRRANSSRVNLLISAVFHAVIIGALAYFAARGGLLGKELKKIAVQMVREKPPEPEKPKEPEKPREELPEPEKPPEPTPAPTPPADTPPPATPATPATAAAPPPAAGPATGPAVAPPAASLPAFVFGGGRAVESSSDPVQVYRGLLEYALRSKWSRPPDVADQTFVAEVEVSVDRSGRVGDPAWKKGSGHERWDESVRRALAATTALTRPPPTNFPPRVLVRFDVQETTDVLSE